MAPPHGHSSIATVPWARARAHCLTRLDALQFMLPYPKVRMLSSQTIVTAAFLTLDACRNV